MDLVSQNSLYWPPQGINLSPSASAAWGLQTQTVVSVGRGGGTLAEGVGAQRCLVALPGCSSQSTWQSPRTRGRVFGLLLPWRSLGHPAEAGRSLIGSEHLFGEILADESVTQWLASRPKLPAHRKPSQRSETGSGASDALPIPHAQSREPAGRTTNPRGTSPSRRRPASGAILKSDAQSARLCVSPRRLLESGSPAC